MAILGVDSDVRNGFSDIKVTYDIDADASPDDIKALVAQSQKRSAVYDIITNPHQRERPGSLTEPASTKQGGSVRTTTVVIGAGHSGLAMSRCLSDRSIDHVVLERRRGRQFVADRAMGLAAPAHAELAVPTARTMPTTATTPTAS